MLTKGNRKLSYKIPAIEEDLAGLPPMLIQVGGDEILLSDFIKLSEKAKNDGVDVKLEIYSDMWH